MEADRQAELEPAKHQHERVRRHSSFSHGPTRTGRDFGSVLRLLKRA
jgi:hypothetical protein